MADAYYYTHPHATQHCASPYSYAQWASSSSSMAAPCYYVDEACYPEETYGGAYGAQNNRYHSSSFADATQFENLAPMDDFVPISPSSSASSDSPLTPAYHAAPLPGLLFPKLDSPIQEDDVAIDDGWPEEGETVMCGQGSGGFDTPGTHSQFASPTTAAPMSPHDAPISCLSPAQTQLIASPPYTPPLSIEIKQPQPKPIIPVISLAALASASETESFSMKLQAKPQSHNNTVLPPQSTASRPTLSLACSVPAPHQYQEQMQLSPLEFDLHPIRSGLSPASASASYPDIDMFPFAMQAQHPSAFRGGPPPPAAAFPASAVEASLPPCSCPRCIGLAPRSAYM
ncbi:hypothetical protein HMN09_00902100 [Mycena chlorophos]|uniref:Uncharacterized protein n=1 Tax=Mycena chlorophos TaxID=658473 RepID=A0A8H6SMT4_MYCCL|nr:hypothetical protein HMN09_00902100 [Mycena chlorophos]